MAVYVTSDAHGHVKALDEVLNAASIGKDDQLFVVGDMIDRGPDPLGVVSLVRSLPNAEVLMGNHEQLMLSALSRSGAPKDGAFDTSGFGPEEFGDWTGWMLNGGGVTATQLEALSPEEFEDFEAWVRALPLFKVAQTSDRAYAIVHAGIDPKRSAAWRGEHEDADLSCTETLAELLAAQDAEDLLWIREEFWGTPTGLVDAEGAGPVVIAGHTPSPYLSLYVDDPNLVCATDDGHGMIVEVGARELTGGIADRVDIDCAAAGGFGIGRVGILRLDDHKAWYAEVREGE